MVLFTTPLLELLDDELLEELLELALLEELLALEELELLLEELPCPSPGSPPQPLNARITLAHKSFFIFTPGFFVFLFSFASLRKLAFRAADQATRPLQNKSHTK